MIVEESGLAVTFHSVTLVVGVAQIALMLKIGAPVLRELKIYGRMKERVNQLWRRHCAQTGDEFVPLENGKR